MRSTQDLTAAARLTGLVKTHWCAHVAAGYYDAAVHTCWFITMRLLVAGAVVILRMSHLLYSRTYREAQNSFMVTGLPCSTLSFPDMLCDTVFKCIFTVVLSASWPQAEVHIYNRATIQSEQTHLSQCRLFYMFRTYWPR